MIELVGGKSTHIAVIPDIIPLDTCSELIESCKEDFQKLFYPGPTLAGVDTSIKWTMDFDFSGHQAREKGCDYDKYRAFEMRIYRSLWAAVSLYVEEFQEIRMAPNLYDTGYRLQKYNMEKGYYRSHHDGAPWDPEPTSLRVLGAVMYLNTVERGGETSFPLHGLKIKATAGSVALFPANWTHPHQSCVPITNDKWIVSSFILSDRRPAAVNEQHDNIQQFHVIDTNPANQPNNEQ